jgi:molybdopterin-guanine dinucleotide biosynthesis protein B
MRLIGVAGWSGSGKTTLIEKLIPCLARRGLAVSSIKHAHHAFDVDRPGKDSWRHRQAGARQVLVSSPARWALMTELRGGREPDLKELLGQLARVDLVLVEGFKFEERPKLEVFRAANGKDWLHPGDPFVRAVASDVPPLSAAGLPWAHLDDIERVADLCLAHAAPV